MLFVWNCAESKVRKALVRSWLAAMSVGVLAGAAMMGCGGGSTNTTAPPPAPAATPTISSFSPTSGTAGTSVIVTGTNLSGATSATIGGAAVTTFSVTNATSATVIVPSGAATGKITIVTPQGSATSASEFTVGAAAPTITSFSPTSGSAGTSVVLTGTNLQFTSSVRFNGTTAGFFVSSANQVTATVPSGATSGTISLTASGGNATSASSFTVSAASGLDLTIDGLYITQATQNYPAHDVGLISGRSAWVRVFVLANQTNTATPQVKVSFVNGSTTNALTINAPGASVPTSVDTTNANTSWNMAVPSAWITAGTTVSADVDPTNAISESNKSNNHFSYGALSMQTVHQWKITLIPVKTGDGRTGTVENASRDKNKLVSVARQLWPVPDTVDVTVGAQMTSSQMTLSSDGTGWNTVLSELLAKRTADGVTDRDYFGFVNVSYNSGVAGLGYIGAPAAIGWDYSGAQSVLAHEVGHNFGRQHSPCGGASNPDPSYPYAGGTIGVPGWDVFAASGNIKPTTDTDIMGYCSNQWVSDYVYKSVLGFRAAQGTSFVVAPDGAVGAAGEQNSTTSKEGLLVWGRIEKGNMILEPAFRVASARATVAAGPYTWEAKDAKGQVLSRVPFQMYEVADVPNDEPKHFAFVVPLDSAVIDVVNSMDVVKGETELALQTAKTSATIQSAMKIFRVTNLPNRQAEIHWDAITHPVAMLRDAKTGEVRGFLRGGDATIDDVPDHLEIQLSDGVKSSILTRPIGQ